MGWQSDTETGLRIKCEISRMRDFWKKWLWAPHRRIKAVGIWIFLYIWRFNLIETHDIEQLKRLGAVILSCILKINPTFILPIILHIIQS